jgi:hypothetical protein
MNRISAGFPEATASRVKGDLFNDFLLTEARKMLVN